MCVYEVRSTSTWTRTPGTFMMGWRETWQTAVGNTILQTLHQIGIEMLQLTNWHVLQNREI